MSYPDYTLFADNVGEHFSFLEDVFNCKYSGIMEINDGPRDSGVVVNYECRDSKISIGWSPSDSSLGIMVKKNLDGLSRAERFFYFEPFMLFISEGKAVPVVPQIYPGMSVKRIEKTIQDRQMCFKEGFDGVLRALAGKLEVSYPTIESVTTDLIKEYHKWYMGVAKENR